MTENFLGYFFSLYIMEDIKIATVRKKRTQKEKSNDGIKGYLLSFLILVLIGLNLLFVISWTVQALEKKGMADPSNILFVDRPTETSQSKKVRVEIFNACGVQGVAKELTDYLRRFDKIDVVYYGNYDIWNLPETLIIDRRDENLSNAKRVGSLVGVKNERLFPHISLERQVEVTVLIGKNYTGLKAFKK